MIGKLEPAARSGEAVIPINNAIESKLVELVNLCKLDRQFAGIVSKQWNYYTLDSKKHGKDRARETLRIWEFVSNAIRDREIIKP